jgi:Holliday junction resolvase
MSRHIKVGLLQFEFDNDWNPIEQWDEHPAYKKGLHQSPGDKAVDIVGMRESCLYFVEVKDYRIHPRQKEAQHLEEFEKKVVGTVAGIVGAHRCEHDAEFCRPLVEALTTPSRHMVVVYWVELPENEKLPDVIRQQRRKSRSSVRTQEGKGRLGWLRARYLEMNKAQQDERGLLPGLKVSHLRGSG